MYGIRACRRRGRVWQTYLSVCWEWNALRAHGEGCDCGDKSFCPEPAPASYGTSGKEQDLHRSWPRIQNRVQGCLRRRNRACAWYRCYICNTRRRTARKGKNFHKTAYFKAWCWHNFNRKRYGFKRNRDICSRAYKGNTAKGIIYGRKWGGSLCLFGIKACCRGISSVRRFAALRRFNSTSSAGSACGACKDWAEGDRRRTVSARYAEKGTWINSWRSCWGLRKLCRCRP